MMATPFRQGHRTLGSLRVLLRLALRGVAGSSPERVVVCFHLGRCGSTVLGDLVDQHRRAEWDGEIFHGDGRFHDHIAKYGTDDPFEIIDVRRGLSEGDVYAFEIKPLWATQLGNINTRLESFVDALRRPPVTDFVILERENYLRRILSVVTGRKRGRWHQRPGDDTDKIPVEIPMQCMREGAEVRTVRGWFELYDEVYARLDELLPGDDTLRLTFEDDIRDDPTTAYRKVCDFLGIGDENPEIRYSRSNPWPLEDILVNYSEVASVLEGTRWQWMLEERGAAG